MSQVKKELFKSLISVEDKLELYRLEKSKKFVAKNAILDTTKCYFSDSKKYKLEVTQYDCGPNCTRYTLGSIYKILPNNNEILITTVQRNYNSFPYLFVENHPNGHDYLVCGEDYQGQTIIELDTGDKKSWIPAMGGFCWVNMKVSPSKNLIAVDGCFWACGYEIKIFDFSKPMNLPFDCFTDDFLVNEFSWNDDDSCSLEVEYETRKSDGKPIYQLTDDEKEALDKELEPGINQEEIFGYEIKKIIWNKK